MPSHEPIRRPSCPAAQASDHRLAKPRLALSSRCGLLGSLYSFHWLEREGLKDTHDGYVSFIDVIYFTMISATTTGYGDIVPVTDRTRLFDALVVTPIRILFLLIFVGSAYAFVARRSWERFIMKRIQRTFMTTLSSPDTAPRTDARWRSSSTWGQPEDIVVIDTERGPVRESQGNGLHRAQSRRDPR